MLRPLYGDLADGFDLCLEGVVYNGELCSFCVVVVCAQSSYSATVNFNYTTLDHQTFSGSARGWKIVLYEPRGG